MKGSKNFFASVYIHARIAILSVLLILVSLFTQISRAACSFDKEHAVGVLQQANIASPVDSHVIGQWVNTVALRATTYITISEGRDSFFVNVYNETHGVNRTEPVAVCSSDQELQFEVAANLQDQGLETVVIKGHDPQLMSIQILNKFKLKGRYERVDGSTAELLNLDMPEFALRQIEESVIRRL